MSTPFVPGLFYASMAALWVAILLFFPLSLHHAYKDPFGNHWSDTGMRAALAISLTLLGAHVVAVSV